MSKVSLVMLSAILFVATAFAASASVDVLYVATTGSSNISLATYNVDPTTAVAKQVGSAVNVGAANVDPVTVGTQHVIYVWDSSEVWLFVTNAQGVPQSQPAQHLKFNFAHPVTTFLADPDGKFAYAGMVWTDSHYYNNYAAVVLFNIDQATGKLTTGQKVATYGPDPYIGLTGFLFGASGKRLYASFVDSAPFTCFPGYDYYNVNQQTGQLGTVNTLLWGSSDCAASTAIALTDSLTGDASSCCGTGSGYLTVNHTGTPAIHCTAKDLPFCGDVVADLFFDPASQNVFFGDADTGLTDVGHLDFTTLQLIDTGSTIPGTPPLYFSPDSRLVYASNAGNVGIYGLESSTGKLGANTTLPDAGNVGIATATLH